MNVTSWSNRRNAVAVGAAGLLLIQASFMAWVRVRTLRISGVEVEGSIVAVMGILVVLLATTGFSTPTRAVRASLVAAFLLVTYVSFAFFITWSVDGMERNVVGPGLVLAMLVSLIGLVLAGVWLRQTDQT